MFGNAYSGKRVLVTGHTGFKGSWLVYWLQQLGAEVCGYSLPPPTQPSHWSLLNLKMRSETADVRDAQLLRSVVADFRPDAVFHLAAQPLVRRSYEIPVETFQTNVMGTVNLLDACRTCDSVKAIINITSDKCYENREWDWGYRETDPMGGHDPYSASKGCSELVTAAYRKSFFNHEAQSGPLLASCRAGNVVGGGDWAVDRLLPDIMRAAEKGEPSIIRNPHATRPWQHVLEPLSGYLLVGQRLIEGESDAASAWNIGPRSDNTLQVHVVADLIRQEWPKVNFKPCCTNGPHEATQLKLDSSRIHERLGWEPVWNVQTCFKHTVKWYRGFYEEGIVRTADDLMSYIQAAVDQKVCWARPSSEQASLDRECI